MKQLSQILTTSQDKYHKKIRVEHVFSVKPSLEPVSVLERQPQRLLHFLDNFRKCEIISLKNETFSKYLGICIRTVQRATKALEADGYITKYQNNPYAVNIYTLNVKKIDAWKAALRAPTKPNVTHNKISYLYPSSKSTFMYLLRPEAHRPRRDKERIMRYNRYGRIDNQQKSDNMEDNDKELVNIDERRSIKRPRTNNIGYSPYDIYQLEPEDPLTTQIFKLQHELRKIEENIAKVETYSDSNMFKKDSLNGLYNQRITKRSELYRLESQHVQQQPSFDGYYTQS